LLSQFLSRNSDFVRDRKNATTGSGTLNRRGECVRPAQGCFSDTNDPEATVWTAAALPSVVALTGLPPGFRINFPAGLAASPSPPKDGYVIERLGVEMRVRLDSGAGTEAVLLPFDGLFESEWLLPFDMAGARRPPSEPAALSQAGGTDSCSPCAPLILAARLTVRLPLGCLAQCRSERD
jgi:hypothetical protein